MWLVGVVTGRRPGVVAPVLVTLVLAAVGVMAACTQPADPPDQKSDPTTPDQLAGSVRFTAGLVARGGVDPVAMVAFPHLGEPPAPPQAMTECGGVYAWLRQQGAVDVATSLVEVRVWASAAAATVTVDEVAVVVLERREPFETRTVLCASDARVPAGAPPAQPFGGSGTGMLDQSPLGAPVPVPATYLGLYQHPQPLNLEAGQNLPYLRVRLDALDGWYRWELVVHATVDGEPVTMTLRDGDAPFTTNSGFRESWPRSEAYVWCAHDQPPKLRRQSAPFLCPRKDGSPW